MKIAVIAPTYLPARRANTVQVMKMTQALAALGHDVRLAVPHPKLRRAVSLSLRDEPSPGIPAWGELAAHYGLRMRFPIVWLPVRARLRSYDFGYQAVHWARGWGAEVIFTRLPQAAAFASMRGIPTILEVHDMPQGTLGPILFRRFLRGRGAQRLVVITRALAADLAQTFNAPSGPPFTLIAPDGVDLERYENLPTPAEARRALAETLPAVGAAPFIAGYTGHLYAGRGREMLLALAERLPGVTFLLVGGEPADVERVRTQAASRGLGNVILTGFIPNAELPRYQAACDVLLMPYQARVAASSGGDIARYLSPMKMFEYLACGRAILSSDLPVLREALTPGNAALLPPTDVEAWATALRDLQTDPSKRAALAQQAKQDAAQYSWAARGNAIFRQSPT